MNVQTVPSAVARRIIIKFITNENVKPAETLRGGGEREHS
jgi:hypothetical protein